MKPIRLSANLLATLSLVACTTSDYDRLAKDYLQRSPLTEATSDFNAHDYKIFSAMGVGHYYPGLDPDVGRRISAAHGEKMLPGTTDAPESRSQDNYIGASTSFAAKYNKKKVSLIKQHER